MPLLLMSGIALNFLKELLIAYFYGAGLVVDTYRIAMFVPFMLNQAMNNVFMARCSLPLSQGKRRYCFHNIVFSALLVAIVSAVIFRLMIDYIAPGIIGADRERLLFYSDICWALFVLASGSVYLRSWLVAREYKRMVPLQMAVVPFLFLIPMFLGVVFIGVSDNILYASYAFSIIGSLFVFMVFYKRKEVVSHPKSLDNKIDRLSIDAKFQAASLMLIIAMAFNTLSRVIDRSFATSWGAAYVSEIDYAYNIFIAIGTILGTSIVINTSKHISLEFGKKGYFSHLFRELSIVIAVSVVLVFLVCSWSGEISALLYGRGAITEDNISGISDFLVPIMYALPLMIVGMVVLHMLFARASSIIVVGVVLIKVVSKYFSMKLLQSVDIYSSVGYSNLVSELMFILFGGLVLYKVVTVNAVNGT